MVYKELRTIEDYIFDAIKTGPHVIVDLVREIQKKREKTTKQGVYSAIRVLKKEDKVIVYGGKVSLNSSWLNAMADYFSLAAFHYTKKDNQKNDFLNLQDGERIQYNFKDPITTDTFWGHAQNILIEAAPQGSVILSYDPHYWPLLVRPVERELLNHVLNKNFKFFMVAGGKKEMDKILEKEFNSTTSQYWMVEEPIYKKRNYYVSIIGDFVIEVYLNKKIAEEIDQIYNLNVNTLELKEKIVKIISKKANTRFVVSRNKRKADALRRKLMKYFVITASMMNSIPQ